MSSSAPAPGRARSSWSARARSTRSCSTPSPTSRASTTPASSRRRRRDARHTRRTSGRPQARTRTARCRVSGGGAPAMVTAEEIRTVRVFENLDETALERLARVAADISLVKDEFAAEEGGQRALFAVLEGKIQATRLVDGIDRVLGDRYPGDIFGEVPITLGTLFPVGFRASEPTRVMRIEPQDYHAVASVSPEVALAVG